MNAFLRTAAWAGVLGIAAVAPAAARGAPGDEGRDEVRARIAAAWGGFVGVECHATERVVGEAEATSIDFAWGVEGRSSWSQVWPSDGGIARREIREDSRRRTSVRYFETPPEAIDRIQIEPMRSEPGRYGGPMLEGLWALLPGGRTVAGLLDGGGTLANAGSARRPRWTIDAALPPVAIRCVLDAEHQDLPAEVTVRSEGREVAVRVDRFERSGDFWYPAEGSSVVTNTTIDPARPAPARVVRDFRLDRVAFNRAIDPRRFAWEEFPPGAEVANLFDNSIRYVGGKLARIKLHRVHDRPSPAPKAPTGPPVRVPVEEVGARRWVQVSLFGVVVVCGGLAWVLRRLG